MSDSLKCRRETKSFLEELRNSLKQFSVQSKKSNSNVKNLGGTVAGFMNSFKL